jgi:hypothetical protein
MKRESRDGREERREERILKISSELNLRRLRFGINEKVDIASK